MLVLIILVYACCHSIRETSPLLHSSGWKDNSNSIIDPEMHLLNTTLVFSLNQLMKAFPLELTSVWRNSWPALEVRRKKSQENWELIAVFFVSGTAETEFSPRMMIATSVSHLLITVNSSINFAIYCIKVRSEALRWHYYIVIIFYYRSKHSVKATILGIH